MDYIIKSAASRGIYIGMVCIWGTPVEQGLMNEKEAVAYGKFLAERYKDEPNIIWMIGGDIRGDNKTEVWDALANSIRSIDKGHLMTFHPRGRTTSATWFNDREWLDFNMFQSGHRRYGQRNGDGDYPIEENTEEDNWRFVEASQAKTPLKPVIDDEPIMKTFHRDCMIPMKPVGISTMCVVMPIGRYSPDHSGTHTVIMISCNLSVRDMEPLLVPTDARKHGGCFGRSRLQSDEISEELDVDFSFL